MDWPWPDEKKKVPTRERLLNFLAVLPFFPMNLLFASSLAVEVGWGMLHGHLLDPENYRMDLAQGYLQIGATLVVIGILVYSWLRDFPLWTYPYWVLALIMTVNLPSRYWDFMTLVGSLSGPLSGYEPLGWYGLLPAALVLLLILLLRRSIDPLRRLVSDLRAEPSRVSFLIYCLSPVLVMLAFRQAYNGAVVQLILEWALGGAALACLSAEKPAARLRAFAIGQTITWLLAGPFLYNYWRDHANNYIPDMPGHQRAAMLVMVLSLTLTLLGWVIGRRERKGADVPAQK